MAAISCCSPLLWNAISLSHRRPSSSWSACSVKPLVVVVRAQVNSGSKSSESSEQKWVAKGLITESLPNGMFWVRLENGDVVLGYISGKIRRNSIRMLPGDKVKIEVSRYDSTRGRIVYRIGNKD
ncbi:hypothetical protein L1987_35573 [Smallanthus sonchifolius]|uniref:Uncharacterized protein n=1 Tax=Smallanthus sonchifolius TaxID=185202 RepID=A0ACB9HCA4_9ASTR|nr:hypothetical protein L1987_35573 [Smallanthus sonchifolius]